MSSSWSATARWAGPRKRRIVASWPRPTAACPPALLEQLADGGRLVIPIGPPAGQELECIERPGDKFRTVHLTGCRFVPLVGGRTNDAVYREPSVLAKFHTPNGSENSP